MYCKDGDRPGSYEHIKFDFLGYTFQPRRAKNRWGKYFIGFLPAISNKAAKAIRQTIREWRMASTRNNQRLEDLARLTNPVVRGWMNYYGRFYRSKCVQVLRHLNEALGRWVQRKFKRFKRRERASMHWLGRIARRDPNLVFQPSSVNAEQLVASQQFQWVPRQLPFLGSMVCEQLCAPPFHVGPRVSDRRRTRGGAGNRSAAPRPGIRQLSGSASLERRQAERLQWRRATRWSLSRDENISRTYPTGALAHTRIDAMALDR